MQWFGEPWPSAELRAPVCEDDNDRVPVPIEAQCLFCGKDIVTGQAGISGLVLPHINADGSRDKRYSHVHCLAGNVGAE